jgi:hypothetical protein
MDKVLVTLLLIIAGVVCSVVVINAVYPAVTGTSGAISDAAGKIQDRIRSQIKVIEMGNQSDTVYVWVKNVGSSRIGGIENSDIFFGPEGNFSRIAYGGTIKPYWNYSIENDTKWGPSATMKITIHLSSAPSGTYIFKMIVPNGISDETYYSTT